jgi:hypothetical protein
MAVIFTLPSKPVFHGFRIFWKKDISILHPLRFIGFSCMRLKNALNDVLSIDEDDGIGIGI